MSKGSLKIIEAAIQLIARDGIINITLEKVATEAGMSKGGLLYHFATKDKLLEALIQHQANLWRESYRVAYERAAEGPGRMARAILDGHLLDADYWTIQAQNTFAATVAALAYNPTLHRVLTDVYAEVQDRLADDELPPGVSEVVSAAVDGIWLNWGLGVGTSDGDYLKQIHGVLSELIDRAVANKAAAQVPCNNKPNNKT